jgi:2-polyprenyl-3-methyl-5-hydroxy-6-metoxy-1,4-benzoquinol methylase
MNRLDPATTRAHWDALAGEYDDLKRRNDAYYRTLKACFDLAVPQGFRGRVLEVGCGTGQVLAWLRPLNGVGIDASANMIEQAKRQFSGRSELTFATMDGTSAGGLGEFDAVISADVLEHVADWPTVVGSMVQACRKGGAIAISTPNPRWALPLWVLEKLRWKMPEGPHRFVRARAIAARLDELGCQRAQMATALLLPVHLGGVGPRLSKWAEHAPILRHWGVIQMVTARKV